MVVDVVDDLALRQWLSLASSAMDRHQGEINALNVFPVPDGDTGTNMALTMSAGVAAVDALPVGATGAEIASVFSAASLAGARGNSGVILSAYLQALLSRLVSVDAASPQQLATATLEASQAAYGSVSAPMEGTILSVGGAVAQGAQTRISHDPSITLQQLAVGLARDAASALELTPEQLPVLARAGVVDAGGRGLVVLLESLVELVTGTRVDVVPQVLANPQVDECSESDGAFEVIYLLDASGDRIEELRRLLAECGVSVVVAGADHVWRVHVHTDDVGSAIEAGLAVGKPSKIRITDLRLGVGKQSTQATAGQPGRGDSGDQLSATRGLVAVAHGPGMVEVLESAGATVVRAHGRIAPSIAEILAGIESAGTREVVVLPSSSGIRSAAEAAAAAARERGVIVAVIPTRSIVQTLAAVAVHNPLSRFEDDVVSMTSAATATHYGGVSISTRAAMTSAGRCAEGDVLGIIEGDVVEIGDSISDVAHRLLTRLMSTGGELVTIVRGDELSDETTRDVISRIRRDNPAIEIVEYDGGQPVWPLIVGVE
jgi:DAK2 domain fusion protein YloV